MSAMPAPGNNLGTSDVVKSGGNNMPSGRPLHRSTSNRILGGVCGGIADWLGWSPTTVRVLYVIGSILSVAFPGALIYVVLWLVMPKGA